MSPHRNPSKVLRLIAIWLAWASLAIAQPVGLSIFLERPEVTHGDRARVELVLTWSGSPDAYTVVEWVAPETVGTPLAVELDQVQTGLESGQPVYRRRVVYSLKADVTGMIILSPARVKLKGHDGKMTEHRTQSLTLAVAAPPARLPWPELGLGFVAVLFATVAVRAGRRTRPGPAGPTLRQKAQARVGELRAVGMRDHREFYEACLTALKDGLAIDHGLPIKDRDRERISRAMAEGGLSSERCRAAGELFALCDEARFNPERPQESARNRALTLLEIVLSD